MTLLSQPAVAPLLREAVGLKNVIDQLEVREWAERKPVWLPLLDLLPAFQTKELWTPFSTGYMQIKAEEIHRWSRLLDREPGKRLIALHWQGNPGHEQSLYSRGRSLHFEQLMALGHLANVEFVSIQKGSGSEQCTRKCGLNFVAGQESVSQSIDFIDTAAVLANCDLLISSDSAVVHLAGAMGIPTWLALRWIPEWRWGLEGERTAWYDSVRLFRQPRDGDWDSTIQTMVTTWKSCIAP